MNDFYTNLSIFSSLYYEDNYTEIINYYLLVKSQISSDPNLLKSLPENHEFFLYEEETKILQSQVSLLFRPQHWVDVVKQDDILIQTMKSTDEFAVKLSFTINADPLKVFSVFYESELCSEWMKTIKLCHTVKKISTFRKKIQNFYKLPWPLVNRHSILHTRYSFMPELKTIIAFAYSPKENHKDPVNLEKFIEMILPSASGWIKCNQDSSDLTLLIQANKYVNMIPQWIVNFLISKTFVELINDFKTLFTVFDETSYLAEMNKNKNFYRAVARDMNIKFGI